MRALKEGAQLLYGHKVKWLVVGSTSLALQGVDVEPEDIDIICSKEDAFEIGRILKKYETRPVGSSRTHLFESYMGEYAIHGVKVQIMGDFKEKRDEKWFSLNNRLESPHMIDIGQGRISVSTLVDQLESYERLGRHGDLERAQKINEKLES